MRCWCALKEVKLRFLNFLGLSEPVCTSLPAGVYEYSNTFELDEDRFVCEGDLSIPTERLDQQILALYEVLSSKVDSKMRNQIANGRMTTFLFPIISDCQEFRKLMSSASCRKFGYDEGFTETDKFSWNYRDISFCDSWLIELVCNEMSGPGDGD